MVKTIEEQKEFLNKMIESYQSTHNQTYFDEIHPYIKENAMGKVLDLGCGPGLLLKDIHDKYKSEEIIGIDLSPIMLKHANKVLKDIKSKKLITQHLQENQKIPQNIDLIFASRVLRSFEDTVGILQSISNSLNADGKLVLLDWDKTSIQNYASYFDKEIELSNLVKYYRNFSIYSIHDWVYILERLNFKIEFTIQLSQTKICIIAAKTK